MSSRAKEDYMTDIIQFLFSVVMIGSVYGLIAAGFCMVYNATEVINFAQGEFVMLGAMLAASVLAIWGWPIPLVTGKRKCRSGTPYRHSPVKWETRQDMCGGLP